MVFHICLTIDISAFIEILYFFGIGCDESFPHSHHGISFYIISLLFALSPFVFIFSSGQTAFCKAFSDHFQKKQVSSLYIHFFRLKLYKKGGCLQPPLPVIRWYPAWHRHWVPCRPCVLPKTHNSPGHRSWRRYRRKAAKAASTASAPAGRTRAPDPPGSRSLPPRRLPQRWSCAQGYYEFLAGHTAGMELNAYATRDISE